MNQVAHRLSESFFILTILMAIYLVACLASYTPTDPGPFNAVATAQVHNIGRVLGAWLANFFLFLTGYLAYALPLVLIGLGISIYHNLLYYGVIPEALSPCSEGVSCTEVQLEWLGFITIPMMALAGFVTLSVSLLAHQRSNPRNDT